MPAPALFKEVDGMETNCVIHGDCLEVMKNIPDKSIDVSFTSPPYNRKRNDKYEYYDDTIKDYYSFLKSTINELLRITKRNIFFNIQKNFYNKKEVYKIIGEYSEEIYDIIIWEKNNPTPSPSHSITNSYEFILCFGKELKSNSTYSKNHIKTNKSKMIKEHKAIMHLDVAKYIIMNFTKKHELVLDCFGGSGTTAVACINLDRKYILIEQEKKYIDIIHRRIELANIERVQQLFK